MCQSAAGAHAVRPTCTICAHEAPLIEDSIIMMSLGNEWGKSQGRSNAKLARKSPRGEEEGAW